MTSFTLVALLVSFAQAAPPQRPPSAPAAPSAPARGAPAPQRPSTAQASTAPIRFEPPAIVLGAVAPRSQNPVKFTVRNTSTRPVTILDSRTSCKCTAFDSLAGTTIAPGGTVEISATMDAPAIPGNKDAHIFLIYDENAKPVTATIRAVVRMPVEADPPFVDIRGGKLQTMAKIKAFDGRPFRILSTGGDAPMFASTSENAAAAKGESRAEWTVLGDFSHVPDGQMMQYWIVEIDRADCPIVPVQVRHELTGVRFDEARNRRCWLFGESLANAGRLSVGQPYDGVVEIASFTPDQGRGPTPPANWGEVRSLRSLSDRGTVEMLGTDTHGDKVVVRYRFTPSPAAAGRCIYAPIELATASGAGNFYLTASVAPQAPQPAPTPAPSGDAAPGGSK